MFVCFSKSCEWFFQKASTCYILTNIQPILNFRNWWWTKWSAFAKHAERLRRPNGLLLWRIGSCDLMWFVYVDTRVTGYYMNLYDVLWFSMMVGSLLFKQFKLTSKLKYYIWSHSIFAPGIIQTLESGHCHANGVDLNSTNPLWRGINSQGNAHFVYVILKIHQNHPENQWHLFFLPNFDMKFLPAIFFSQFVDGRWNSTEFIRDPIWSAGLKVQALASASVERRYGCSPEDMTMAGLQNALELRILHGFFLVKILC